MDLVEIRMRCIEAASKLKSQSPQSNSREVLKAAEAFENWVLNAEQDALRKLREA